MNFSIETGILLRGNGVSHAMLVREATVCDPDGEAATTFIDLQSQSIGKENPDGLSSKSPPRNNNMCVAVA